MFEKYSFGEFPAEIGGDNTIKILKKSRSENSFRDIGGFFVGNPKPYEKNSNPGYPMRFLPKSPGSKSWKIPGIFEMTRQMSY